MRAVAPKIDVAAATGLEGAEIAGTLFLPHILPPALELLVCLHGGGYDHRYWQPNIPGYNFASQREASWRKLEAWIKATNA